MVVESDTSESRNKSNFELDSEILSAISESGFECPTKHENECIESSIFGKNILYYKPKPSTRRTAVLVFAILQKQEKNTHTKVLVIFGTRDQMINFYDEYSKFSEHILDWKSSEKPENVDLLQMTNILVGTPKGISKLIGLKKPDFAHLKHILFYECDDLLEEIDILTTIRDIFHEAADGKHIMVISSKLNNQIPFIYEELMKNPVKINESLGLKHFFFNVNENDSKTSKLIELLNELKFNQALILMKPSNCDISEKFLRKKLEKTNIIVKSEKDESEVQESSSHYQRLMSLYQQLKEFFIKKKEEKKRVIIASHTVNIKLDIGLVDIVFNYYLPENCQIYSDHIKHVDNLSTKGLIITFVTDEDNTDILENIRDRFDVLKLHQKKKDDTSERSAKGNRSCKLLQQFHKGTNKRN